MRYEVALTVETEDNPEGLLHEIVSCLEFEHRAWVARGTVTDGDGLLTTYEGDEEMTVKFIPNDKGNPPGKLADAELHFSGGPLDGLRLIGFSVWERKSGGRNVTFPARQYSMNGERRSYAILRPVVDTASQEALRDLMLEAYKEHEAALLDAEA